MFDLPMPFKCSFVIQDEVAQGDCDDSAETSSRPRGADPVTQRDWALLGSFWTFGPLFAVRSESVDRIRRGGVYTWSLLIHF